MTSSIVSDGPLNPSNARVSLEGDREGVILELVEGCEIGELDALCALEGCALESCAIDVLDCPTGPSLEPGIDVGGIRVCFAVMSSRLIPDLILNCVWPR